MKNDFKEDNNFWIAYADLMAGLLFVFILLIGAIVVKYVLTQSDLKEIKDSLTKQEARLEESKQELKNKEAIVFKLSSDLNNASSALDLANLQKAELEANITNYKQLSQDLNSTLDNKDKQILILLGQLEKKDEELASLKEEFNQAKEKIQNLGLMRENLSKELQKKLDNNITINDKTGAISLPAEVLFDKDSYVLKNEAKAKLRKILSEYFDAIMNDPKILSNIENIIIEGHTDSDGSYIYNLDLSQKRAYEVMNFIYSFYKDPRLQKLLMASGRSFSDPIMSNGVEDKDKSRRIEIKFSIKNDNALKDVENFFEFH
ncbi:OmpA family protein [Campylobacter sp. RM10532]|uniref:OmpA family protein n=1 Tax=Campylobacter molothri TaxID=1032242 RepID=A0ACC5W167_9BACT|nr:MULTISPECIES: OmpA family protein [unclassified Campylobacter]MBZ7928405.1 OmpA family protein [Campylobacter sp. RM10542]MBZ7931868.1 OmpA family protein [Campylobacter sp. RM12910]MBZ7932822.1 OmpA family protein [Campylobacter sp. RM10543]MBZ7933905.1 OmpA family protein [Campylobacter sp. W0065]MBZ7941692.1 OmpA family protein [Campylobacter sp. W0045]MBZ7943465.1 OmpA family protein [Campylobacter sp. RM13744]MBZ7944722.1 OmpA family protein [Campylobacter sp. RM10532]MBZ7947813.1 O